MATVANTNNTTSFVNNDNNKDPVAKGSIAEDGKPQVGTSSNKTLATCINNRVVKGIGKTLLVLFTVPAMATLEALIGFVVGVATAYVCTVVPIYAKTKIGALTLAATVAPLVAVVVGVSVAMSGAIDGIRRGVLLAYNGSCKPLKDLCSSTVACAQLAPKFTGHLSAGASILKAFWVVLQEA